MTPKGTFAVSFWENTLLRITVRATSPMEAKSIALSRYADARHPCRKGFDVLDTYDDEDWQVEPVRRRKRRSS